MVKDYYSPPVMFDTDFEQHLSLQKLHGGVLNEEKHKSLSLDSTSIIVAGWQLFTVAELGLRIRS